MDKSVETWERVFDVGEHTCKYCAGPVKKYIAKGYLEQHLSDKVPYPRSKPNSTIEIRDRINLEMKTMHWQYALKENVGIPTEACLDLLYQHDLNQTIVQS